MKLFSKISIISSVALSLCSPLAMADLDKQTAAAIDAALSNAKRSDDNKARDQYRKPKQVLDFLGLRSDMTVVEIWPGGGWYTEVLAPVLKDKGKFYAAHFNPNTHTGYMRRSLGSYLKMLGSDAERFGEVEVTTFDFPYFLNIAPKGSADMVLTFRNAHNWMMPSNGGGKYNDIAYQAMFDALKPGGVLGVVDHQWDDPKTEDEMDRNGYISTDRVIAAAEKAGFKLVAESQVLDNPKDSKDHPKGVWTLPPSMAMGETDAAKYKAIGESDRFLLKFVKPE